MGAVTVYKNELKHIIIIKMNWNDIPQIQFHITHSYLNNESTSRFLFHNLKKYNVNFSFHLKSKADRHTQKGKRKRTHQ